MLFAYACLLYHACRSLLACVHSWKPLCSGLTREAILYSLSLKNIWPRWQVRQEAARHTKSIPADGIFNQLHLELLMPLGDLAFDAVFVF